MKCKKSLLEYWDVENVSETSFNDGIIKGEKIGLEKGKIEGKTERNFEIARNLRQMGLPIKSIAAATGLTSAEIERL